MGRALDTQILAQHLDVMAEEQPDHRILTFESPSEPREINYGELWTRSNRLAALWHERGVERGDTVAILMNNYPEFVYALVASSISGVLSVSIDPRTRGDKLAFQLAKCEARVVMCTPDLLPRMAEVASQVSVEHVLVHTPSGMERADGPHDDLDALLDVERPTFDHRVDALTAPHQIIFTSGTTGDPKGMVMDNARLYATKMFLPVMGIQPDDVFYTGLSLTHANAQMMTVAPAWWHGHHAVLSERFTKRRLWDICRRYGCTTFTALGGIMSGLYAEPPRPDDADNPVRIVHSAGTPPAIWESFERRFDVRIHEWYGTAEGGIASNAPGQGPIGSFGKPLPGTWTMRVAREDGTECDAGETGQMVIRPANGDPAKVVYYCEPEASARKVVDGWLQSGDMVHHDNEGWFYFDYRAGGGIRHNGDFVHPDYVERAIAERPDVDEVYVFGVPAASGAPGERDVVAAIVPADRSTFDATAVYDTCQEQLEANSIPSYLYLVPELPKTISEKVQERFLVEQFDREGTNVHARPSAPVRSGDRA